MIEELSGRSFDQFFDQWVYHAHFPEIEAAYSWDQKSKLAKLSIKQVQKLSENVLLFNFPLTVRFKGKSGTTDRTIVVKEKEEDFYFALAEAPEIVRIDPEYALLSKVNFKLPNAMLYAQLADKEDMVGRLMAIEQLAEKKDQETVKKLKHALENDPFYGVRIEAAKALQTIHSDEALEALLASKPSDARVRNQVAASIGGFFATNAFARATDSIATEKNPEIRAHWIRALGNRPGDQTRSILVGLLEAESYRNTLADAAISAMRTQDDPYYIRPLQAALQKREAEFTTRGFAAGLDALASLSRNEKERDAVRDYLTGYVNHQRKGIQLGAIAALGTLEDPKANAILATFTSGTKESDERKAAEKALRAIRAADNPSDNLKGLREEILDLKKESRETKRELEALRKKFETVPEKPPVKKSIRSPKDAKK